MTSWRHRKARRRRHGGRAGKVIVPTHDWRRTGVIGGRIAERWWPAVHRCRRTREIRGQTGEVRRRTGQRPAWPLRTDGRRTDRGRASGWQTDGRRSAWRTAGGRHAAHSRRKQVGIDLRRFANRVPGRDVRRRGCIGAAGILQLLVELQPARRIHQAQLGQQQLVEQLLPTLALATRAHAPHARQCRVGRGHDALLIVFEVVQGEQLIVVERAIGCPQPEPLDVRIKRLCHGGLRFGDAPRKKYE